MKTNIFYGLLFGLTLYLFLASFGVYFKETMNCTFNSSAPCEVGTGGWLIYSNK